MKTAEIRSAFLKYFEGNHHTVVSSDSLIPSTDPTLLFTSAGMVQFKPNFQNPAASPYPKATSCQKCLRTSDIERVGQTLRHLTFFEMLGNFSFGDYFKKDAIAYGWEFLTKKMGLPGDRFIISVHKSDDEAFQLWSAHTSKDRIVKLDDDTNFWTMGPTGPCGPCSEILWDRGAEWSCGKPTCGPACDCDRYLEIWNLVFTQFDRSADGKRTPLPRKNIDTGMGLERLSVLMQNAASPFGTDGFQVIFKDLAKLSGKEIPQEKSTPGRVTLEQASFRRIADHARAITFMISDGILPSNEGRGYVLRRLLRQAVRAGKTLGINDPFLHTLTGTVVNTVKASYPETEQRRETIQSVVKLEEERFLQTLDTGTRMLQDMVKSAKTQSMHTLPGKDLFQLYDTFGFPFELTREMAEGFGLKVDTEGFEAAQKQAVELARGAWKGSGAQEVDHYRQWKTKMGIASKFIGYDTLSAAVPAPGPFYRQEGSGWKETTSLQQNQEGEIILADTPFYPEGGGQVGDTGTLHWTQGKAEVLDTQQPVDGFIVHRIRVIQGTLNANQGVTAQVDGVRRAATMRHHTATHMLHKALRDVLGTHVTQAGSLVAPDRLRFDFNHHAPLTPVERQRIEDLINEQILGDLHVRACAMTKSQAQNVGAMMLFGEKYGDNVRTISITQHDDCEHIPEAWSLELCGGTHVHSTGQIGLFKIISQSSVSSGVRRLEAVAGHSSIDMVRKMEQQLLTVADALKTSPEDILPRLEKLIAQERQLEKQITELKHSTLRDQFDDIAKNAKSVGGVTFISHRMENLDDKQLRDVADRLRDSAKLGLVVLASAGEGKVSFVVSVQKQVAERGINAGHVAKELALLLEGSGGGRPDFAQGGGKNPALLDNALAQVETIIKKLSIKTHP